MVTRACRSQTKYPISWECAARYLSRQMMCANKVRVHVDGWHNGCLGYSAVDVSMIFADLYLQSNFGLRRDSLENRPENVENTNTHTSSARSVLANFRHIFNILPTHFANRRLGEDAHAP